MAEVEIANYNAKNYSLDYSFKEAEKYGAVYVHSNERTPTPNRYYVYIAFQCVPGVTLKAASDFNMSLQEAFTQAISRAKEIVKNVKQLPD